MHPKLSKDCPSCAGDTARVTAAQALAVLGAWLGVFAAGFSFLP